MQVSRRRTGGQAGKQVGRHPAFNSIVINASLSRNWSIPSREGKEHDLGAARAGRNWQACMARDPRTDG
eukprot:COSAG02_NODE_5185_length_4558_cov_49.830680_3_plen_69_part_00